MFAHAAAPTVYCVTQWMSTVTSFADGRGRGDRSHASTIPCGRTRMIVGPLIRSVGSKAATASSRSRRCRCSSAAVRPARIAPGSSASGRRRRRHRYQAAQDSEQAEAGERGLLADRQGPQPSQYQQCAAGGDGVGDDGHRDAGVGEPVLCPVDDEHWDRGRSVLSCPWMLAASVTCCFEPWVSAFAVSRPAVSRAARRRERSRRLRHRPRCPHGSRTRPCRDSFCASSASMVYVARPWIRATSTRMRMLTSCMARSLKGCGSAM